jgi:hypothetical protein
MKDMKVSRGGEESLSEGVKTGYSFKTRMLNPGKLI